MDQVDAVVVGAGVVGLAVARQLALAGREVLILEAAARFGTRASARNSEVIHAGIYYPPGSLKARLCVRGRERLYEFCAGRAIPHRRCEKLIVATTDAELPGLARVAATAQANGVELTRLDRAAAQALEPQLSCAAALHSPLTGIIDSQACMLALLGDAESRGASLACGSAVTRVVLTDGAVLIGVNGAEPALRARTLVNCAGVQAPQVARLMEGLSPAQIPAAYFVKGSYFALKGRAPFERLIYPLPDARGSRGRVGGQLRLPGGCAPRARVLRGHSPLLARSPRRCARARLRGCAAADLGPGRAARRFSDRRRPHARRAGTHQPLWNRVSRAHGLAGDRRGGRGPVEMRHCDLDDPDGGPRAPLGPRYGARVSWRGWPPPGSRASRPS